MTDPNDLEAQRKMLDDALRQMAAERGVQIPAPAAPPPQMGPPTEEILAQLAKPAALDPEFAAAQQADEAASRTREARDRGLRYAAMARGVEPGATFESKPVADAVRKYLERKKVAEDDPQRALLKSILMERFKHPNADVERSETIAKTGKLGAETGKIKAEIPGVEAETAGKVRGNQKASPELLDYVAKLGIKVTPDMTYKEAKDRIDEALKARGLDIEEQKVAEGKGAKGADIEGKLRAERNSDPTIKATKEVSQAFAKMKSAPDTGTGDLSLIYAYVKLLDPGSVVREGEIKLSREPTPLLESLVAAYGKAKSGKLLHPNLRRDYMDAATKLYQAQMAEAKRVDDNFRALSGRYGVNADNVVLDLGDNSAEVSAPSTTKRIKVDAQGNVIQ